MKKRKPSGIQNKRARFDFDIKDEYVVGLVLTGAEVKSLRMGRASLRGAHVTFKDGGVWLLNAHIMPLPTNARHLDEQTQVRTRKLLLKHKEVAELLAAHQQGMSIVPIKILTRSRYIKVVIGVGRGMKKYDKREVIKQRETQRNIAREMR
jgi:SsrA-binding protein